MMKHHCIYFVLLLAGFLSGCAKDTEKPGEPGASGVAGPVIDIVDKSVPAVTQSLCGVSYDNVLKVTTGTALQLKMHFRSNMDLSQYKIDIHNNFDCHTHGRVAISGTPWFVLKTEDLSGKDTVVTAYLPVPADASAGNYHLMIRLLDVSGNEADFVEFNVIVLNPDDTEPPFISLYDPATDSISVTAGSDLVLEGVVTDNVSLQNGKAELSYTDAAHTTFRVRSQPFLSTPHVSYRLNMTYTIPSYAAKGVALFYLKAYDAVHNEGIKTIKVNIR